MYQNYIKRICDLLLGILALFLLSWLFIVLIILIKFTSQGTAFFMQKRAGKYKKDFYILKFRTMRLGTPSDVPTHELTSSERYITPIGKFLRRTSLDELPQIINIIIGQMSFVGPRPALWNQYDLLEERDKYGANDVKPGLTGWAQINGRDELPIHTKAILDGEYVEKISLKLDCYCILKTASIVFKQEGIKEGV